MVRSSSLLYSSPRSSRRSSSPGRCGEVTLRSRRCFLRGGAAFLAALRRPSWQAPVADFLRLTGFTGFTGFTELLLATKLSPASLLPVLFGGDKNFWQETWWDPGRKLARDLGRLCGAFGVAICGEPRRPVRLRATATRADLAVRPGWTPIEPARRRALRSLHPARSHRHGQSRSVINEIRLDLVRTVGKPRRSAASLTCRPHHARLLPQSHQVAGDTSASSRE